MDTKRRAIITSALSIGALWSIGGCQHDPAASRVVPLINLNDLKEGETAFPLQRVTVMREGKKFRAMSLLCTHQACIVGGSVEKGFQCPCHGSLFNGEGHVLQGPAVSNLPWFKLVVDQSGMLSVDLGVVVGSDWRLVFL